MYHQCSCVDKETRHARGTVLDTPGTRHVEADHAALVEAINRLGAVVIRDLFIEPGYAQRLLDQRGGTTSVTTLPTTNADDSA